MNYRTCILINILSVSTIVALSSTKGYSQKAKEFYFPDSLYNKTTFFMPGNSGGPSGITRTIYYVKKGTGYNITDAHFFEGQPTSIVTQTVIIGSNDIKMTKNVLTNAFGTTNKKTSFNPPITLFKLPAKGQSTTWTTKEQTEVTTCTASWTVVTNDGKKLDAVVVKKQSKVLKAYTLEYYVEGMGLWKTEIVSNGKTKVADKFDALDYDSSAS